MDAFDRKIISFLQTNGRIAHAKIGNEINLSTSAVNDRVKRLQETEIIKNTVVTINPSKIGLNILAFISVLIDWNEANEAFGTAIHSIPEVLECHHVTGDWSYLLKVRAKDNDALEELISNRIKRLPGVTRSETIFVLSTDKETTELSLNIT
jgi:Lrp/AsnC family leucine-responsive transcriptional regulator